MSLDDFFDRKDKKKKKKQEKEEKEAEEAKKKAEELEAQADEDLLGEFGVDMRQQNVKRRSGKAVVKASTAELLVKKKEQPTDTSPQRSPSPGREGGVKQPEPATGSHSDILETLRKEKAKRDFLKEEEQKEEEKKEEKKEEIKPGTKWQRGAGANRPERKKPAETFDPSKEMWLSPAEAAELAEKRKLEGGDAHPAPTGPKKTFQARGEGAGAAFKPGGVDKEALLQRQRAREEAAEAEAKEREEEGERSCERRGGVWSRVS
eukprot:Hpha_TRINITY_DN15020_c6_g2::TRINITY_DN15020_c6_g2_i1::g.124594::m.124594